MGTLFQMKFQKKKKRFLKSAALGGKPQARGRVWKNVIVTPRKPNSALRKTAKVFLTNGRMVSCKVAGSGKLPLKHSTVLVRGVGYRDTPGVNFSIIRGVLECLPLFDKNRKRSLYGNKKRDKAYISKRSLKRKWVV